MEKYINYAIDQIINLCKMPSPSGYTKDLEQYIKDQLHKLAIDTISSNKGSIIIDLGGEGNPLVLAAHIDTLGAMVRSINAKGTLRLTKIGGFVENSIEGENCYIHTRTGKVYTGTIQLKKSSVHVNKDIGDIKRDDTVIEVVIDEKVKTKEEVQALDIDTGDFISFDSRTIITKSNFIKSRHLDDKASVGLLMALAKYFSEQKLSLNRKVYIIFTNYEEVGHGGASGIPKDITEMISVDMGAIGDDLTTDEYKVSICAKDSNGPYDYDVTSQLIELAKELELNYAVDIYPYYGSDVDAALSSGYDIKHGLIGPGISASHGYERTHREAIENTFKLLKGYIKA